MIGSENKGVSSSTNYINMAIDIKLFDPLAISFLEMKKNNIINGNFSKTVYCDSYITINGIYVYFQMIPNHIISYAENIDTTGVGSGDFTRKRSASDYSIFFLDSNSFNLNVVNELSAIEHKIIDYYKEFHGVNKTAIYQLKMQLQTGNIKIYNNDGTIGQRETDNTQIELRPREISTKTQRTPIHHYYTNAYTNMSLKEAEDAGVRKNTKNYILKISGVWENKFSIGITYKFIEMKKI